MAWSNKDRPCPGRAYRHSPFRNRMNDFLKELWKEIPRFLEDFVDLLTGPKAFLGNRKNELGLRAPIVFYVISVAIASVLYLPFLHPGTNIGIYLVELVALGALAVVLNTLVYSAAWRLVGGKAQFRHYVVLTFYVFGIVTILSALTTLGSKGICKVYQPESLDDFIKLMDRLFTHPFFRLNPTDPMFKSGVVFWAMCFFELGALAAVSWLIATWGGPIEASITLRA